MPSNSPRSESPPGLSVPGGIGAGTAESGVRRDGCTAEGRQLILETLQVALGRERWPVCAAEVVSGLAHRLSCLRVSLGWVVSGHLRVVALSEGVLVQEGVALPELSQAMLESVHQQCTLHWPQPLRRATHITLAHQSLHRVQGLSGLLSIPLAVEGKVLGVLTFERSMAVPVNQMAAFDDVGDGRFDPPEIAALEALSQQLAPLFRLQYLLHLPWHARLLARVRQIRKHLASPAGRTWRWGLAAAFAAVLAGLMVPVPNRVTAPARLEGAVQRVLGVAQDGFLRQVLVRPGDVVREGQLLVELSDDDLKASRRARLADVAQQENAFAEAFARSDRAQAGQAQAKLAESRAQLELVDQQLARVQVLAPFDGVVIAGDLQQQLGAPVKRGDALLTLAPGLDWRVVLDVSESDVADLRTGQTAVLRLASRPQQAIALVLERITPVARSTAEGVRYVVEARPTGLGAGDTHLRPGLEGVAKVDLPPRPWFWRGAEKARRWVSMAWWTWF